MTEVEQEPRWRRLGPDARRNEIMAAAIRLFGERPYGDVSIAEIANEAGVARALVNHYCGTKRELYLKVVRLLVTPPPEEDFEIPVGGSLDERVDLAIKWLLTVIEGYGVTWVRITGAEGVGADPEVQKVIDDADHRTADLVLDAVGYTGTLEQRQQAHIAVVCFGSLVKAVAREWIERESISREQAHAMLSTTLRALLHNPDE